MYCERGNAKPKYRGISDQRQLVANTVGDKALALDVCEKLCKEDSVHKVLKLFLFLRSPDECSAHEKVNRFYGIFTFDMLESPHICSEMSENRAMSIPCSLFHFCCPNGRIIARKDSLASRET
jgi:hypothetical protein